ncbi:MAG: NrfD/PsrC family molybdoenzyme membrane anchor subunit [Bacteroidota bacterium]
MKEEIIISGRNNHLIDPVLNVWHWEIPAYLFLGGLSAGILFFAAFYHLRYPNKAISDTLKKAVMLTPIFLVLGLGVLMLDLKNPLMSWRLYTSFSIESPMSWGAWTLMLVVPLSFMWSFVMVKDIFPNVKWPFAFIDTLEEFLKSKCRIMAWILLIFSIILGIYTGILLSAFNARPFWSNPILGPLFLVSGMSTAAALITWLSKDHEEIRKFTRIDLWLISVEIFMIIHVFMGMLAGTQLQIEGIGMFLGGEYTYIFFGGVIILGLLLPALLELLEMYGKKIPAFIPAIMILIGGLIFRIVMVEAGQVSSVIY